MAEHKQIYNIIWEDNYDGEKTIDIRSCDSLEVAKAKVKEYADEVMHYPPYSTKKIEYFQRVVSDSQFFIKDPCDDNYVYIHIISTPLITKA